jgi:ADP-ribosyl-[dinitrogen reductase] hydrolase
MTNRELLEYLFQTGRMDMHRSELLDAAPPPLPKKLDPDRIEGMLLGLAIGDALGMTTEGPGWSVARRRLLYPADVADYCTSLGHSDPIHGRGTPSDDTQLSFWTLEQLLADGELVPENVARLFVQRGDEIVGRGGTVAEFIQRGEQNTTPWYDWAPDGVGNGALMRIAPVLLPHLKTRTSDLWVDAILAARLTHNSSVSLAACAGLVHLLWRCLGKKDKTEPQWWMEEFAAVIAPLERKAYLPRRAFGIGANARTLAEVLTTFLPKAFARGIPVREACGPDGWASSSFVLETTPSLLYILMRHGHDFEEAILRAVNDTHDNDTIASMVGAVLGALYGRKAIPERWITNLTGRTRRDDDGQVFRLISQALQIYS